MTAQAAKYIPEGGAETPYQRARQEWDRRIGSARVQARNWRFAAFAFALIAVVSVGGAIYLGTLPKVVTHVIEVDQLGAPAYVGIAGQSRDAYKPSDATIKYHLHRFIEQTRSITADPSMLKRSWIDAYKLVTPRGENMLTAFVTAPGNDPFKRARNERVSVEVQAIVRVSSDTWQADWREKHWDTNGNPTMTDRWRGMFSVVLQPPTSVEGLTSNPIGLYIAEFHWDRVGE